MHILVIDDEEQLCRSIAEGLRMDGYETYTCLDGDEGQSCSSSSITNICMRILLFSADFDQVTGNKVSSNDVISSYHIMFRIKFV